LRDKIYGIRPLLTNLKLTLSGTDYSKTAEEVFEQFSKEFITNTESLWILGLAVPANEHAEDQEDTEPRTPTQVYTANTSKSDQRLDLPTWVVDWTTPAVPQHLCIKVEPNEYLLEAETHRATFDSKVHIETLSNSPTRELKLRGKVNSTITATCGPFPNFTEDLQFIEDLKAAARMPIDQTIQSLDQLLDKNIGAQARVYRRTLQLFSSTMIQLVRFLDFSILYGHAYSTALCRAAGAVHPRMPYLADEGPIFDAFSKLVLYRVKDHGTEDQRRSFIPLFTHLAKLNWG
jgi:hypothetical protein